MRKFILLILLIFIFVGCSFKNQNIDMNNSTNINLKTKELNLMINELSNTIDKNEAKDLAYQTIIYSKKLAKEYKVETPALFHNTLINMNIKKRGLCYHYANDLLKYLKTKQYKSFKFIKTIANRNEYFEHTAIAITTKNVDFKNSIVLDAWRNTGDLFFSKIKDDQRYKWEKK